MDYSKKLKNPKWQKKRLEILNRDNWTCRSCECKDKTLHVHHITYDNKKNPWEYDNKNLVTLCEICHETWHKIYDNCYAEYAYIVVDLFNKLEQESVIEISNIHGRVD